MHELAVFGLLALAVSQLAWIIADSNVFQPVRSKILHWRWEAEASFICSLHASIEEGVNCASCVGMWVAFAVTLLVMPDFIAGSVWVSVPWYTLGLALVARGLHAGIELLKRVAVDKEGK